MALASYADVSAQAADRVLSIALERECRTFTRYLAQGEADEYVTQKYAAYQQVVRGEATASRFDAAVVRFAAASPGHTRVADAYTRVFLPQGTLRRKLVLLAAILENAPGFHRLFGSHKRVGVFAALALIARAGMTFAAALTIGAIVLGPVQVLMHGGRLQRIQDRVLTNAGRQQRPAL